MFGRQELRRQVIARHAHASPYAAVVLEGVYEEAGEAGRFCAGGGCVLIHAPFCAHQDRVPRSACVLNLPLPMAMAARSAAWRIADPDGVARAAERGAAAAVEHLVTALGEELSPVEEAPDLLARRFSDAAPAMLAEWARETGVARATAFRWFKQAYGVAPTRYRVEARARRAWRRIVAERTALSMIASEEGFSDQAHMTRAVRGLTGHALGVWRGWAQHSFKNGPGWAASLAG